MIKKLTLVTMLVALAVVIGFFVPNTQSPITTMASTQAVQPFSNWVQWQQPTWFEWENEHGTVSHDRPIAHWTSFTYNAFNNVGWQLPGIDTIDVTWTLQLNYTIQIQSISFDLRIWDMDTWWEQESEPARVRVGGQEFGTTVCPSLGWDDLTPVHFNFTNWETNRIDIHFPHFITGRNNTRLSNLLNVNITANVAHGHFSAFDPNFIDKYIPRLTFAGNNLDLAMIARDFRLLMHGSINARILIGTHPIRLAVGTSIEVHDYVIHPLGVRVMQVHRQDNLPTFFMFYENGRINIQDRHFIDVEPNTPMTIEITSTMSSNQNNAYGTITGWTGEPQVICRMFTVYVRDINNHPLGTIEFEMDLTGSFIISTAWLQNRLPEIIVGGQYIDGFFLVNRDTGEIGTHLIFFLGVTLANPSVIIALNYTQITHTITFRTRHGSDNIEVIETITLNWGTAIPDPAILHPNLPVTRGWLFREWTHSPFEWTSDWQIVPIIGTPLTQDITFTAEFRRLTLYTIRFFEPHEDSWGGVWNRMIATTTLYENEIVNLAEIMTWAVQPQIPLSQHTPNIVGTYTWNGGWITDSGFLVGHVLGDGTIPERPFSVHWTYLNFVPHFAPIEFLVSFMGWDGGYLARVNTVGGYIDPATIPNLPTLQGLTFSHWFNSNDLTFESRITAPAHFWAVYVPSSGNNNGGNDNGNDNGYYEDEFEIETWMIIVGGATAFLVVFLIISAFARALQPKKKRRF